MDGSPELNRLRIIYVYKILFEKTDKDHGITLNGIITELERYGVTAARRAIYNDIESLCLLGLDIMQTKGKNASYRLAKRDFELAELKLLADAVNSSRILTYEQCRTLLAKLRALASENEARELRRQLHISHRSGTFNSTLYANIDLIYKAISENRQIKFRYFDYGIDKKKKYREGGDRICSPYELIWEDERYYLAAFYPKYGTVSSFRVDRMEFVRILDKKRDPLPQGFDMGAHLDSMFSMFSGEDTPVSLKFENELINPVLDRFGMDTSVIPVDDKHFRINVRVKPQPPFFAWLFQFGGAVEVLTPGIRSMYEAQLKAALEPNGDNANEI